MVLQFGDGVEPWSVARGGVKRWLHCRVAVDALSDEQRAELTEWLSARSIDPDVAEVVVTRGDDGHRLHAAGEQVDVALTELPLWLQRTEPQPASKPSRPTRRRGGQADAGGDPG